MEEFFEGTVVFEATTYIKKYAWEVAVGEAFWHLCSLKETGRYADLCVLFLALME